jgi:methoxymalonate biosynthesis acyl carrier protein
MTGNRLPAIREFIGQHVPDDFADDQDIFDTTGVSSLFAVQLVMWVQRRFGVDVQPADLDISHFRTVRDIAAFIDRKLSVEPSPVG